MLINIIPEHVYRGQLARRQSQVKNRGIRHTVRIVGAHTRNERRGLRRYSIRLQIDHLIIDGYLGTHVGPVVHRQYRHLRIGAD